MSRAAHNRGTTNTARPDAVVIAVVNTVVAMHRRWGSWTCHERRRLDGYGLESRADLADSLSREAQPYDEIQKQRQMRALQRDEPTMPNEVWAIDVLRE
jgi:hypothetical protein